MKWKKNQIETIEHKVSLADARETIARSIALLCLGYHKTASEPYQFVKVQKVLSFSLKYILKPRSLLFYMHLCTFSSLVPSPKWQLQKCWQNIILSLINDCIYFFPIVLNVLNEMFTFSDTHVYIQVSNNKHEYFTQIVQLQLLIKIVKQFKDNLETNTAKINNSSNKR